MPHHAEPTPMSRRARYAAPIVIVLVLGWALWPRETHLLRFTSQPFTIAGRQVRYQLLLPSGWTENGVGRGNDRVTIMLAPRPRFAWIPTRLKKMLRIADQEDRYILIAVGSVGPLEDLFADEPADQKELCTAMKTTNDKPQGSIYFACADRPLFRSTYRQICESFRVIE